MTDLFKIIQRFVILVLFFSFAFVGTSLSTPSYVVAEEEKIRISKIRVRYADDARINWWGAEREYMRKFHNSTDFGDLKKPGESDSDAYIRISKGPKAQAWVRKKLTRLIKASIKDDIGTQLSGRNRVVLDVKVREFFVPDPARRLMIGGFPELHFKTTAKYARNGRKIGTYDQKVLALALGGMTGVVLDQAFPDLEDRILENHNEDIMAMLMDNV